MDREGHGPRRAANAMTTTHELPPDRRPVYDRARRLAWWTIAYLVSVGVVLYLVLGPSQAIKAAWLETVFSIATPVLFLVSGPVRSEERRVGNACVSQVRVGGLTDH